MAPVAAFTGMKWRLDKSENFDEYLKALGVGIVTRKVGSVVTPLLELEVKDDEEYVLRTTSPFKNTALTFKLGQEFIQNRADGVKVKTVVTVEDNKLIENQLGDKPTTIVREFLEDEVITTLTCNNVVCTRIYKSC